MNIENIFSRYAPIIPDYKSFIEYLNKPLMQSFRVNTLKAKREQIFDLLKDFKLNPVSFYNDAFCLTERSGIGYHFSHGLGLIYAQEVASMVPALVLDPKPGEVILDLCASPGSKTTQIAQIMGNTGLIIANELNRNRMAQLLHNVKRCGLINEVVISLRGEKLGRILPGYFDRILIDAPCSLEGTIRKTKAVLQHWGMKNINRMAWIQKGLAVSGFRALRPGGTMVYSTCTVAPEENEGVIDYLLKKFPEAEIMPTSVQGFKCRPGVTRWQNETYDKKVANCARIFPQDNDTEPFFMAKMTKTGVSRDRFADLGKIEFKTEITDMLIRQFGLSDSRLIDHAIFQNADTYFISTPQVFSFVELKALRKGLEIGKIYDHELKPDNDFAQIFTKDPSKRFYAVKDWELRKFLGGELISAHGSEPGFTIITYKNLPVGIGRSNGREIKSEISRERRIREKPTAL